MALTDCPYCHGPGVEDRVDYGVYHCELCDSTYQIHNDHCAMFPCRELVEDGKLFCDEHQDLRDSGFKGLLFGTRKNKKTERNETRSDTEPHTPSHTACPYCKAQGRLATTFSFDLYRCTKCKAQYFVKTPKCRDCHRDADLEGYCLYCAAQHGIHPDTNDEPFSSEDEE